MSAHRIKTLYLHHSTCFHILDSTKMDASAPHRFIKITPVVGPSRITRNGAAMSAKPIPVTRCETAPTKTASNTRPLNRKVSVMLSSSSLLPAVSLPKHGYEQMTAAADGDTTCCSIRRHVGAVAWTL